MPQMECRTMFQGGGDERGCTIKMRKKPQGQGANLIKQQAEAATGTGHRLLTAYVRLLH